MRGAWFIVALGKARRVLARKRDCNGGEDGAYFAAGDRGLAARKRRRSPESESRLLANGRIQTDLLLIGAEPEMLELLDEVLSEAGFDVTAVHDAGEIEANLSDTRFDVVVCDEYGDDLDGRMIFDALLESAQASRPGFVLLSDTPDGDRIASCLTRDMEEYVVKPFDVQELVARIWRVVRSVGRLREARAAAFAAKEALAAAESLAAAPPAEPSEPSEGAERVGFSGDLEFMTLPDLLMNLHQNGQTGALYVVVGDGDYIFYFQRGELIRTTGPRGLKSRKAFFRAMREHGGVFRFVALDQVNERRSSGFDNLANVILQAVQEADEYPLTRNKLPSDPAAVAPTTKVDDADLPENSVIQPLIEGLVTATTIDILIHACPKTDLEAARELEELMMAGVLAQVEGSAAAS